MKSSKFTHAQKAFVVKQGEEGIPTIMLANSDGETSPPTLGKGENSRPAWSDVG